MEDGERQKVSSIQAIPLVSVCIAVFLTGIFLEGFIDTSKKLTYSKIFARWKFF